MKKAYLLLTILALFLLFGCSSQPSIEEKDESIISLELTYSPAKVLNGDLERYGIQYKITYNNSNVSYVDFKVSDLPLKQQQKLDQTGDVVIEYLYQGYDISLQFEIIEETDEIKSCEHDYVLMYTVNSNCVNKGYTVSVCACGTPLKEEIAATNHNLSDWTVITEATCEEYGEKERHCLNNGCQYFENEDLAPLGHTHSEWIVDTEATCTTNGASHVECTTCETVLYRNESLNTHTDEDTNNVCDLCEAEIKLNNPIVEVGGKVQFGYYPQKAVTAQDVYSTLLFMAGDLPSAEDAKGWTSYEYYIYSDNSADYMWHKDLVLNGTKYRAVYFTSYRPNWTTNVSNANSSYQDDNGYYVSNVYFFEYKPILWRVLISDDNKALLLADLILDSQEFNPTYEITSQDGQTVYANNYEYSHIRNWLNSTFYNTAFNDIEKTYIIEAYIQNKEALPHGEQVLYTSNNTYDKVFLLSKYETVKAEYGFTTNYEADENRQMKASDYAKIQGCSSKDPSVGTYQWALRTPDYKDDKSVSYVSVTGAVEHYRVYTTYRGIVPAIWVKLA